MAQGTILNIFKKSIRGKNLKKNIYIFIFYIYIRYIIYITESLCCTPEITMTRKSTVLQFLKSTKKEMKVNKVLLIKKKSTSDIIPNGEKLKVSH